jgi:hypothetical protein
MGGGWHALRLPGPKTGPPSYLWPFEPLQVRLFSCYNHFAVKQEMGSTAHFFFGFFDDGGETG